jgi:hypothetical protein
MSELEQCALAYLPRTLPLAGKRPIIDDWPRHVTTRDDVEAWLKRQPNTNIGIRTGDGLAVLDVDPRDDGDETLAELVAQHGELPDTPTVATGGGGLHYYLRAPHDLPSRRIGPGLELKANGCQVVAPPSTHPDTGRAYVWVTPFDPAAIAPLPGWLRAPTSVTPTRTGHLAAAEDFLSTIPARSYVPTLSGRQLDRRGFARCPFHNGGHERTPSLLAGGKLPTVFKCFGCGATGGIYQFAALLAGYQLPLRGPEFLTVREALWDHYEQHPEQLRCAA